ncbi:hypothetical protein HMPREF0072_0555, partial [Anaerococcus lactolyticus ATCC 51172]
PEADSEREDDRQPVGGLKPTYWPSASIDLLSLTGVNRRWKLVLHQPEIAVPQEEKEGGIDRVQLTFA